MKNSKLTCGLGLILSVTLFGCSASTGDSQGDSAEGGTLTIGMLGYSTESLDPHYTNASTADLLRAAQLFDGLTKYTPDGSVELSLAESISSNEDATQWVVKLREGVTFHDGSPLDADDVIFTVERILNPDEAARGAGQLDFLKPEMVSKVDDLTVQFDLDKPYGPFQDVWASNYLRVVPVGFDPENPVGTGPFKYDSFTAGQESTFVRNDAYWGNVPELEAVEVLGFAEPEAQLNALISGQVDLVPRIADSQIPRVESAAGLEVQTSETGQYFPLVMNTDSEPFDDERVRLAMKLIADREELVTNVLNGSGRIANDWISGYGPCEQPDVPQRQQDIERAKQLLAEAGATDLELDLYTTAGTPGMVQTAVVFAEQAKEAGVTIDVHNLDQAAYLEKYTEWPFAVDFYSSPYLELIPLTLLPGGAGNAGQWNDPEFVELADQLFATPDQSEQCKLVDEMKRIEHERGPNVVWAWTTVLDAHDERVQGLVSDVRGMSPFYLNDVTIEE